MPNFLYSVLQIITVGKAFFLLLSILSCFCVHSQGYYFRHYQVEHGLSHNTVFCITQDKRGFMWFGTKDGLNRFDGIHFKKYSLNSIESNNKSNFIHSLFEDDENNLWVGTSTGLYILNDINNSLKKVTSAGSRTIQQLTTDEEGNIFFLTDGQLFLCHKKDLTVHLISNKDNFLTAATYHNGIIWTASNGLLQQINRKTGEIKQYTQLTKQYVNLRIEQLLVHENKVLIGSINYGLLQLDSRQDKLSAIITQNPDKTSIYIRSIVRTNDSILWLGTESGIFIYNSKSGHVNHLKKSITDPYALSDNAIYSLYQDQQGSMWAGSYFGGINYRADIHPSFQKYFPQNTGTSISGSAVRGITKDKYNHLWVGTEDGGLNKISPNGKIEHYKPKADGSSISYFNLHGLMADNNELWIGTFQHGIDVLDIKANKIIKRFNQRTHGLTSNFFLTFLKTSNGKILAGNTEELLSYNSRTNTFSPVPYVPVHTFVYDIMEGADNTIWVATLGRGLYYYNEKTGANGNYYHRSGDTSSISSNLINSVLEDSKGDIWIATEDGGVSRFNKANKQFRHYNTTNGLPANFVFKILEDNNQQIWITTTKGLVKLNPDTEQFSYYTTSNGLLNDQFNYTSGYKDAEGILYFGSVKGMISFNPSDTQSAHFQPSVYITGFQVNNQEHFPNIQQEQINLTYLESSFSIDFASLDYTAPEMISYAYKMEGIDNEFKLLPHNQKVYFSSIAPGKYRFVVKARRNGVWSNETATLTIHISPPWWESRLAYSAYLITGLLLIWYLAFLYLQRVHEKNKIQLEQHSLAKEKELYTSKMEFFTQVAHEIKTPLTLINAPLEKISHQLAHHPEVQKNLRTMQRNTKRLIDLSNQLLDFRLTESKGYSLHFSPVCITQLLTDVFNDFKLMAEENNIDFTAKIPSEERWVQADQDAIQKICYNLISNALKYGNSEVSVKLTEDNQHMLITVYNNGNTIPLPLRDKIFEPFYRLNSNLHKKGTGIGLALCKSLAKLHNGQIIYTAVDNGNIFTFQLPKNLTNTQS